MKMQPLNKSHATLIAETFIPLYLEHLKFLVSRCAGKVTKIFTHFAFEQVRFKKDFILMKQRSRQNAKNSIEKDFFKVLDNANFRYDCRNNTDSCTFEPI